MKIQDLMESILKGSQPLGTFTLPELLRFAGDGSVSGLAVAKETEYELYLALIGGEPEGAIYIDGKGELYGDKALIRITGSEKFAFSKIQPDIVDAVVMGCRIFEKTHLGKSIGYDVPEIGKKSSGIGLLSLTILRDKEPQNGLRVSIRRDGQIVGSDITTLDGSAGFRVMYGGYDCIVQDRSQMITSFHIRFDETDTHFTLEL
jgi:hypothetical protein